MEDYSRYTTPKGQLILNIKPPSVSPSPIISHSPSVPTYPLQSRKEPVPQIKFVESHYTPANNTQNYYVHQNQPNNSFNPSPSPYHNKHQIPQFQNQNYQANQSSNLSFHHQIPQPQILHSHNQVINNQGRVPTMVPTQTYVQTYSRVQPTNLSPIRENYSNALVSNRSNQSNNFVRNTQNVDYHGLGDEDSENSEKRDKKVIDKTICCFPGYWLILLMLLVVFATFFMILIKARKDMILDQQGQKQSPNVDNNGTNINNTANNSLNNTNGTSNNSSTDTQNKQNNSPNSPSSSENTSFQFPPSQQSPSPNSTNQKYKNEQTSFMFPQSQHRHQILRTTNHRLFSHG